MDGDRVGRVIKTKIIVEFSKYFFISRSAKINETLADHPWPAPSAEAPWGGVG